jgi:hypothetical protein
MKSLAAWFDDNWGGILLLFVFIIGYLLGKVT